MVLSKLKIVSFKFPLIFKNICALQYFKYNLIKLRLGKLGRAIFDIHIRRYDSFCYPTTDVSSCLPAFLFCRSVLIISLCQFLNKMPNLLFPFFVHPQLLFQYYMEFSYYLFSSYHLDFPILHRKNKEYNFP